MAKRGEMLGNMIGLAAFAHQGQFDKGGRPYILHVLTVMHMLHTDDEELQCIAIGHDLIEDGGITASALYQRGMSDRVVMGILSLTKQHGETYDDYRAKVKANPDAVRVKLCDLRHNSDIRRLKGFSEKDNARMVRYFNFWQELKALPAPPQDKTS